MANSTDYLKQATSASHRELESSVFAKILLSGVVPERLWSGYLLSKYSVSVVMESRLPVMDELGISRRHLIYEDLTLFTRGTLSKATIKYVNRLTTIAIEKLPAHVYVNYLGDLFGGRIIAKGISWPTSHLVRKNAPVIADRIRDMVADDQEFFVDEAIAAFEMTREIYNELL